MVDDEAVVFRHHLYFIIQHESELLPVCSTGESKQECWHALGEGQLILLLQGQHCSALTAESTEI